MKKKALLTVLVLGVLISTGYFGAKYAYAEGGSPPGNLVQAIAQKFNLDESEVQAVFDSVQEEKMEEIRSVREERLNQAVADGVITVEQKNSLLIKMEEHMQERQQKSEDMQQWFADLGIDETKLRGYLVFPGHFGHHH